MLAWLWEGSKCVGRGLIPAVHLGLDSKAGTGIVMWKHLLCDMAL